MIKVFSISLIAIGFSACYNDTQLIGSWVEPIPGQESRTQGFKLEENGVASSINMSTLLYEGWQQKGDTLILSAESIGNGVRFHFVDTLQIKKLTADSLIVQRKNMVRRYFKAPSTPESK